jgi:hypothetical protein
MIFFAPILAAAGAGGAAADPDLVASEPAQRETLELTVYNRDLALVREVRSVAVPRGGFDLEFRGVPSQIRPASLLVEVGGGTGLVVQEQNYEFDLMSREKILEKYVGQQISWIQENGERVGGRLLGMAAGPVYEVDGEVVFEVPGRMALPRLPENLRARPTLVWRTETERAGDARLDVSYLTGGLGWQADYVLQIAPDQDRADLQGWVTVENRSGTGYAEATLQLVAGDINRVQPPRPEVMYAAADAVKSRGAMVQEETLYDYHLYTVPWSTDLPDNSSKQVSLLDAPQIEVERHYTMRAGSAFFRGGQSESKQDVMVRYSFVNRDASGLGMPLPAGVVRVYGQSAAGKRQLLGEDRIGHTPRNEEVDLTVGAAFDLVAERVRTDYSRVSDRVHRTAWEITLRNHKDEDVTVEVIEQVGGDWEIIRSSLPHEKLSAQEIRFAVPVPAGGETVLSYVVQVSF